ncbi:MAG: shikimate dehydrogenase [Balneolales bacterium]
MKLSEFLDSTHIKQPFVAVLGHPVMHSRSPLIHNAAIQEHVISATYYAIDCPRNEIHLISKLLDSEMFCGANVTIPLKMEIIPFLHSLDESANEIGAVNTIVPVYSKLSDDTNHLVKKTVHSSSSSQDNITSDRKICVGYNTDAYGFYRPLEEYGYASSVSSAVILGSGGASRAVRYALFKNGVDKLTLVSRSMSESRKRSPFAVNDSAKPDRSFAGNEIPRNIFAGIDDHTRWISYDQLDEAVQSAELVVNTTPIGMYPAVYASPVPEASLVHLKDKICYDIIYNPLETKFLRDAKLYGAKTINGLDMFIYQASAAFELWFKKSLTVRSTRTILLNKINTSH